MSLAEEVRRGLSATPRRLSPKWLYDDAGSALYDRITRLPEYYPARTEMTILRQVAPLLARDCPATLVELGSGTSEKTRILLDALPVKRFVPVEVSERTLRAAAAALEADYPHLTVEASVADFTEDLSDLRAHPGKLVAFLGGTLGNLYADERAAFLARLAEAMTPGDLLLLGTDLVKPADRLVDAYHDPVGVTEAFVRNLLTVLNRELAADFDQTGFAYVPLWDPVERRVDLRLRSRLPQRIALPGAGLTLELGRDEELQVEISTKFTRPGITADLMAAGLVVTDWWTDPAGDFALSLSRRA